MEWHVHAWTWRARPAVPTDQRIPLFATAWHAIVPQHPPFDPLTGDGDPWEGVLGECERLDAIGP